MRPALLPKTSWQAIGGSTFLEPKSLIIAALSSLGSSLATFDGSSVLMWATWTLGNFVSFAVLAIPIGIFWKIRASRPELTLNWKAVLLFSAFLGFTKSATVILFYSAAQLEPFVTAEFWTRGASGAMIGLTTLPILSLASLAMRQVQELNRIVVDRTEGLRAKSAGPVASELLANLEASIAAFILDLKATSDQRLSSLEIQRLRGLIQDNVRPTSQAFWSESAPVAPAPSWQGLFRLAIARQIWIWPVLAPLAIGSIFSQSEVFGIVTALQKVTVLTLISGLTLYLMNRLATFRRSAPAAWFATSMLLAGPAAWLLTAVVTGGLQIEYVRWLIGYGVWLAIGSIFTSAARLMIEERNDLSRRLQNLRLLDNRSDSVLRRESRRRANQLHGEVQSQLVSSALLAETGGLIERSVLVEQLRNIQVSLSDSDQEAMNLGSQLERLKSRWNGFIAITYDLGAAELPSHTQSEMYLVIEEAVQNSYRHGLADICEVGVRRDEDGLVVTVIDNGVGSRNGTPGLGSALFSEHDPNWSLSPLEKGGSKLEVRIGFLV